MSKNTKTVKNPATWDKRAIWITAVVVAVVVIAIIIVASIFGNTTINPDNDGSNSGGSSSLTISNGDFLYTQSESTSL
ncbi:MAG: hypothetical protein IJY13_01545, partial [Clostridia bacterium]|nr:hypothetical protein [Clostridia bacterium]